MTRAYGLGVLALACTFAAQVNAQDATSATQAANAAVLEELNFSNRQDFEDATRGFIGAIDPPVVVDDEGTVVWDLDAYEFLKADAPATANPSLWRQAQLNALHGLYEITDGVYHVRGYDLSNMVVIEGETGWIVVDPLISGPVAAAAMDLVNRELGERPVSTVIYTHSHADHFGGVLGVIDREQVASGAVQIIAPEHFMEHAVSENVMAGNAMTRRSTYHMGTVIPRSAEGQIGVGLGKGASNGIASIVPPTRTIDHHGETLVVDGVEMEFIAVTGAEAPEEIMFYLPQKRALCVAEIANKTLHNVYSLRGVRMRDALAWSKGINEVLHRYGDKTDVAFGTHHWPVWGQDNIRDYLTTQRDTYRYIHDETLRLANHGYGPREIANMIQLPDPLAQTFSSRGYYGSLKHNAEAVYNFYFGWFDGNPATLDRHAPAESGARYVRALGGADAVLAEAQRAFDDGDYRWGAEVLNHLVLSDPDNAAAQAMQADMLTQLGYQAESGSWRNFYLSAAHELRNGIEPVPAPRADPAIARNLPMGLIFDLMGVRLDPEKAQGEHLVFNFEFPDTGETYLLELNNSVLNHTAGARSEDANLSMVMDRTTWDKLMLEEASFARLALTGAISVDGNPLAFRKLMKMMDEFDIWFALGTPRSQG
ncbi:MAG: MBL fold metallo-hydrolase [Marinibacterium sp.]|nr:MBL fold metallo-hydrolase [Marinibacterium sp.]